MATGAAQQRSCDEKKTKQKEKKSHPKTLENETSLLNPLSASCF